MTANERTPGAKGRTAKARANAPEPQQPEQAAPQAEAALEPSVTTALQAAGDKKAVAPVLLDLRELASFTDYFIITSGTNPRQVQAIADEIEERLKRAGTRPARIEGYATAEWVLLDYGDFVVHVFDDKARRFYDLERLWRDARRVELPPELRGEPPPAHGSLREG
ncbi:MAG TPA: ribosome silencing factor [Pyrinomonadaceae bacterium]|jgi:ribosome-associated protein